MKIKMTTIKIKKVDEPHEIVSWVRETDAVPGFQAERPAARPGVAVESLTNCRPSCLAGGVRGAERTRQPLKLRELVPNNCVVRDGPWAAQFKLRQFAACDQAFYDNNSVGWLVRAQSSFSRDCRFGSSP